MVDSIAEAHKPDFNSSPDMRYLLESDLWTFTHDQLQQAAKELLPISQRALVHSQIGTALLALADRDEATLQCIVYNLNESRRLGLRASREDDLDLGKSLSGFIADMALIYHRPVKLNMEAAKANVSATSVFKGGTHDIVL